MKSTEMARRDYERMIGRIREAVRTSVPPGADVLVVSKGDPELVELPGARARHFPQDARGEWAGYHPASSSDALVHLEDLRRRGAEYLLLPRTAYWWLSHYGELARHLERHCERIPASGDACRIFALGERSADPRRAPGGGHGGEGQRTVQLEAFLDRLLPGDAALAVIGTWSADTLHPGARTVRHVVLPPAEAGDADPEIPSPSISEILDGGVDYVVVPTHPDGPNETDAAVIERLRGCGRLLAHRRQLGWLFDVMDASARPVPVLADRVGREEIR